MTVSVFVSSRFEEFARLRWRLVARIGSTKGLRAVALDDGLAAPDVPLSRSLSALERSDVMVLFLGSTYADGPLIDGKSVTELEFEKAKSLDHAVFAFAPADAKFVDDRAGVFAKRVMASSVLGTLLQDDHDTCDRVIDSITDHLLLLDYLADARGDVNGVGRWMLYELDALDAGHMATYTPSAEFASRSRSFTDLLEQRRMALSALAIGRPAAARRHIAEAHDRHEGDWGVEYIAARLAAARGLPSDNTVALEHARRAIQIIEHSDATLTDEPLTASTRARRRAAGLLLLARLYRQSGDVRTAEDYLRQARQWSDANAQLLSGTPFGTLAIDARLQAETVRISGRSLDDDSAEERAARQFLDLLREHPDVAAPLVNAEDVKHFQDRLRRDGVAEVHRLVARATGLGIPLDRRVPQDRVVDALAAARGYAEHSAETLRRHAWAVHSLLIQGSDERTTGWRTDVGAERVRRLEQRLSALATVHAESLVRLTAAWEAAGFPGVTSTPAATPLAAPSSPAVGVADRETIESTEPLTARGAQGDTQDAPELPDPHALLTATEASLAAHERANAALLRRLEEVTDVVWPDEPWRAVGWAFAGAAICAVAWFTRSWMPWFVSLGFALIGVGLVIAPFRAALFPAVSQAVLTYRVHRETSRCEADRARAGQLREVVAGRRSVRDIEESMTALDTELGAAHAEWSSARDAQTEVARTLGQSATTATGDDLGQELLRLMIRHNEAFSEYPAVWWPQFVVPELAGPGSLTCIDAPQPSRGGVLGTWFSGRRLVRVRDVGPDGPVVSDLSALYPRAEEEMLQLESMLDELLALGGGTDPSLTRRVGRASADASSRVTTSTSPA